MSGYCENCNETIELAPDDCRHIYCSDRCFIASLERGFEEDEEKDD